MRLTKRDVRIIVASWVGAHLTVGLVWVWSRQGFCWPIAWTHRWRDDLHLVLTWGLAPLVLLLVVWACFRLGRRLDRGRTISRRNRIWDLTFIVAAWAFVILTPIISDVLKPEENHSAASVLTLTVGSGLATALAVVGAVTLWFKGTRGASILMVAYGLVTGAFFAWCLSVWL